MEVMELRLALPRPLLGKDLLNAFNLSCMSQGNISEWRCFRVEKESYFQYAPGKIEEVVVAERLISYRYTPGKFLLFKKPVWSFDTKSPIIRLCLEHKKEYVEISFELESHDLLSENKRPKIDEFMKLFFESLHVFFSCPMK